MEATNGIAFKEWAVVCAALAQARQSLILRKGGIHEGDEGFRVEHREFWLLPTAFHQQPEAIVPEAQPLIEEVRSTQPPAGHFHIRLYAVVDQVFHVAAVDRLVRLAGMHILSEQTLLHRFHYREPGLFVLAVRVYALPNAVDVIDSPYIAGCRSWVELPQALDTGGAVAVLSEEEFRQRVQTVEHLLQE